jgi:hypothetical protein
MYVHFVWSYFDKCGGDFAVGRFDLPSLQSQEILNRPVFVLEILNRVWTLLKILNRSEQSLNITNNSEKALNRVWTFWKFGTGLNSLNITNNSEKALNITENSEKVWTVGKFWTDSQQSLNITEHSEYCLNRVWTMSEKSEHSFSSLLFNMWQINRY